MSSFDDLMAEAIDAGVSEEWVDRVRKATDASPLRKQADALTAENERLRGFALKAVFADAGIKVDPSVLNLPADLDITDVEAVREWGIGKGLAEKPAPTEEEKKLEGELGEQQRMADAAKGGERPAGAMDDRERLLADTENVNEAEFWAAMQKAGMTS